MEENIQVYVEGLDFGVLQIGDWSIDMILSKFSIHNIFSCSSPMAFDLFSLLASSGTSV